MLKRLAIVGLLLAALPPMPGRAAKPAGQSSSKSKRIEKPEGLGTIRVKKVEILTRAEVPDSPADASKEI